MIMIRSATPLVALIALVTSPAKALGEERCEGARLIEVVALDGTVTRIDPVDGREPVALGERLCPGDLVSAGDDGRAELSFVESDTIIGLGRNSTVRIPDPAGSGSDIDLRSGILRFISSVRGLFTVETRHANAGIDGTEAIVMTGAGEGTLVLVTEGDVSMTGTTGAAIALDAGEAGLAAPGGAAREVAGGDVPPAFRPLALQPEGASDWAVHYPPILMAADDAGLRAAAEALEAGDPERAEALLSGRTDAEALALASVVAIFRNNAGEGADLAARAVAAGPDRASPRIAESYALQAAGEVDGAVEAARMAAELAPRDALTKARLAELLLIAGDAPAAAKAAEASVALQPTSLGQAVRGFAALQANDYEAAEAAFAAAVALDSEDPLPRLGQGLLLVRQGRTAEGRRAMELAASLDPRRASIRTELGRAYAQEGLDAKALAQFTEARERDPDDPSPWLASAETLFEDNRPIEALRDLRAAEERAGGRAVLRADRGLAEDRAIRGAAVGRIYDTLGFETQAIQAGAMAAEQDPANAAAHRLLADTLRNRENADVARASSAFRAQVYSPPSKAPIQPSLSESTLAIFEGPAATRPSFAELSPFYEADGVRVDVVGFGGTQSTLGDEASFTLLHRGFALGIGQFHYQTDGYAPNNDVNHDVVSLQAKGQVLPWLDLFGEFRHRTSDFGDRVLDFDLDDATTALRFEDERDLFRLGAHARIGANQDVALVGTYLETSDNRKDNLFGFIDFLRPGDTDTIDLQAQHVGRFGPFTTVAGGSFIDYSGDFQTLLDFGFGPTFAGSSFAKEERMSLYGYATWRSGAAGLFENVELTAGLSIDNAETTTGDNFAAIESETTRVNPKLGVRVDLTDGFAVRAALTRTQQPFGLAEERLEPVTVAGFTQYLDQFGGADVWQGAIGAEARLTGWLTAGAEAYRREVEVLRQPPLTPEVSETEIRGYLDASIGDRIAVSLDVEHLASDAEPASGDLADYELTEVSGRVGYFHTSGFFASGRVGVAWHSFESPGAFPGPTAGSDTFPITELSLGYRLPDRRGIASIDLLNLTDADFRYQARGITAASQPATAPRFARDLTVMARLRLSF